MAEPRSPLADIDLPRLSESWQGTYGVTLGIRAPACLFQVQAFPGAVDTVKAALGHAGVSGDGDTDDVRLLPSGPGRFLVEATDAGLLDRLAATIETDIGTITDLTDARWIVSVDGAQAAFILSKGINVDFAQSAMPAGTVMATGIHGISVLLIRRGDEAFDLFVPTTFAAALMEWLAEASLDVGYAVRGS